MTTAPIPFAPQQASGNEALAGAMPVAMNIVVDRQGAIRRRPGMRTLTGGPTSAIAAAPLSCIHRTLGGDIYAVAETGATRQIVRVVGPASSVIGGLPGEPYGLTGSERPTWAETEMLMVFAGGSWMQKVDFAALSTSRLSPDAPMATHVVSNSLRLLANDVSVDRTKIRYSAQAQGTVTYAGNATWLPGPTNTSGFFTAEARPDPVVAIGENTNSVFVFGQNTLEIYGPDPTYKFARVASMENGCGAPYSITKSEQLFFWIDDLHRALRGSDQGVDVISQPVQRTLDARDLAGAYGYRVYLGPVDCIVFTFPTDGVSLVYQQNVGWSQWAGWDGAAWRQLRATCVDSYTLLGTDDGRIGEFSLDATTDFGDPIRAYVETGWLQRDTNAIKDCQRVQLALRRGAGVADTDPVMLLSWRDRPGPWEDPLEIDLGGSTDTEIVVDLPSLGTYRSRQWRVEFTGTSDWALVSATEDFEVTEP